MKARGNIYAKVAANPNEQEVFDTLYHAPHCRIERILTVKAFDKPGEWYDQPENEWVVLLKGEATLEFRDEGLCELFAGDYILIPAHKSHRIKETKENPSCLWLAVHGNFS